MLLAWLESKTFLHGAFDKIGEELVPCLVYRGVQGVLFQAIYCSSKERLGKSWKTCRNIHKKQLHLISFSETLRPMAAMIDFQKGKRWFWYVCLLKTSINRSDKGKVAPAMSSVQPSFSSFFSRHFQDFDLHHPPCRDAQVKQTASRSLKPLNPYHTQLHQVCSSVWCP